MSCHIQLGVSCGETRQDFEIFNIGDGASDVTPDVITSLVHTDSRIGFFDHPNHERRGEPHRHSALQKSPGRVVCSLCDRDLKLPDHLKTKGSAL